MAPPTGPRQIAIMAERVAAADAARVAARRGGGAGKAAIGTDPQQRGSRPAVRGRRLAKANGRKGWLSFHPPPARATDEGQVGANNSPCPV